MSFKARVDDYATVEKNPHSAARWVYDAAMRLPQAEHRQREVLQTDGIVRGAFAAASWVAGIEDAMFELSNLVTMHDNGGTASSPKKIKAAARELLRLLGEE